MRDLPVVKQCCCGCTLETGTKIIAWLQIVGGAAGIFAGISAAVSADGETFFTEFVTGIPSLIFGIALLMSIQKKRPVHINAWVISNLVGILLYTFCGIIYGIAFMVEGAFGIGLIIIIFFAINIAITFYYVVVVSSFRKEMVAAGNMGV